MPAPADLRAFTLASPPEGFVENPYPVYAALRRDAPVHRMGANSWLLTRHADVLAVYRSGAVSSDKRREFGPKFGEGTPLLEHHTTSLVFNDPPLHTRVRRILMWVGCSTGWHSKTSPTWWPISPRRFRSR
jgi:cytochrome P450